MDGPAPAIVNAITDALGISFNSIPLLPEDIFEALTANGLKDPAPALADSKR
jgi:CO/xanthine dehydrogenase Mo-binding subunit